MRRVEEFLNTQHSLGPKGKLHSYASNNPQHGLYPFTVDLIRSTTNGTTIHSYTDLTGSQSQFRVDCDHSLIVRATVTFDWAPNDASCGLRLIDSNTGSILAQTGSSTVTRVRQTLDITSALNSIGYNHFIMVMTMGDTTETIAPTIYAVYIQFDT